MSADATPPPVPPLQMSGMGFVTCPNGWGVTSGEFGPVDRSVHSLETLSEALSQAEGVADDRDERHAEPALSLRAFQQHEALQTVVARTGPTSLAEQKRWSALRRFGDFTLAYNTAVQDGLEYFWSEVGYVAFARRKGQVFVLGDPVTSAQDLPKLLDEFLREFPRPTFLQISAATAGWLEQRRFYINEMGVDTVLDLANYSFAGKSMEKIRYASNWLKKHGYRIEEETYSTLTAEEAQSISQQWRANMKFRRPEMRFLNRPIRYLDERDVRKFVLRDSGQTCVAFMYFDPLYRDGEVIGYSTSIKRRSQSAPLYAEQGLMRAAIEKFQAEGRQQVNLGLSPLAWIENQTYRCNPLLHFSFRYAFRAWWVNRFFYNLVGHAQYKRHFKGRELPFHYASPVLLNDFRIANLMRLTGIY